MIAQLSGTLAAKEIDRIQILTEGGVAYELAIPLGVFETLPAVGQPVRLHTHLVVRDDALQLVGFSDAHEKRVFLRLISATGVGPSLAIGMLSALSAERLVRAIRERDVATLQRVPRVGKKTAERIIVELADKLDDIEPSGQDPTAARPAGATAEDAVRALVSLGYHPSDAEKAVRWALEANGRPASATELIRAALTKVGGRT